MLNEHDLNDWIETEVQLLENVQKTQTFTIPASSELYRPLYEASGKVYAEVVTEGQYKGLAFAFPKFLNVHSYERKH